MHRTNKLQGIALAAIAAAGISAVSAGALGQQATFKVVEQEIEDLKEVFATVRTKDRIEARVRTPGTVVSLKATEGAEVQAGELVATVADPKIALRIKAVDAQIVGLESKVETARLDYERTEQLRQRGVAAQARVDQSKAAFDLATNELKAARAERQVAEEQASEGQVLAPAGGRVLRVPVTEGSVVMAGESVATIGANAYLLRLEVPERHARFMKAGDPVTIAERGLETGQTKVAEGRIVRVLPELQGGRVVADAEVAGLGGYFVGERALVRISAGKRRTFVVPRDYVFTRFGLDFVRIAGPAGRTSDVVVQTGGSAQLANAPDGREILAGVVAGDVLVHPPVKP